MEPEFSHGMNAIFDHGDRQRRSWNTAPSHFQNHYQDNQAQSGAHTLPPIQSQRHSFDHAAAPFEQSRQPPMYSTQATAYPSYVTQAPHPSYGHALPHFPTSSSLLASAAPAMPMTQGYATPTSAFPQLRPMPAPTSTSTQGLVMPHAYVANSPFGFPNPNDESDMQQRTHVVGSQGRRGILPSAEGKPAAVASNGGATAKTTVIPPKDADGKFPCPHCSKTYLHGKHLKRHLLRHTGDRPYTCFLCQDTFSRSDILKRHFQKCSIRRGNPTGANHLQHAQPHRQKQNAKKAQTPTTIDTSFAGVAMPGPHSASPIYTDSSLGVSMNGSGSQSQPESAKTFNESSSGKDQRSFTNPSAGFSRPNFNYMAGHSGGASLPSSGGSTPLTAKSSGHFQNFPNDAGHQRANSFAEVNHRTNQPGSVHGSQLEGNGFDWASYSHGKGGAENHMNSAEGDEVAIKNEEIDKSRPTDLSDANHADFISGLRGGYIAKSGDDLPSINR